ncbi:mitochondrial carrier domain-containing protein [Cantharellus anzutake]|uniref:mitochondrial carrier domain-containing protein n=1 Tax=Cantharellus anzutake TaxID=1750568 RepID=UPI0019037EC0|nr:mitochondrial carrier domain-containing protein [Cantharellus anzutake]KAF8332063.1 mitochondrial carrier domain-containing protein [Cantharellus anzutake]
MASTSAPAPSTPEPRPTVSEEEKKSPLFSSHLPAYFIKDGCEPLRTLKDYPVRSELDFLPPVSDLGQHWRCTRQVQPRTSGQPYHGVWRSLVRMWKEEGFKGFMRGNGINCVRIIPYSAVQFTTYEQLKKFFTGNGAKQLDTPTRLLSGALAGITSVSATYPLDLVRARLSIASATMHGTNASSNATAAAVASPSVRQAAPLSSTISSSSKPSTLAAAMSTVAASSSARARGVPEVPGMWAMTLKVMREEGGVKALYRGIVPTAVGVAPYVGINFAAYESLRGILTPPGRDHSVWRKLTCGALAGSISQTLTYPFDVLRRKMQVTGLNTMDYKCNSAFDVIRSILYTEGPLGFYRGIWPNLLKVAPSIATSFYTYELVKEFLQKL